MSEIIEDIKTIKEIDSNIGVYCVGSRFSKIIYIGQTTNLKTRLNQHKKNIKYQRYVEGDKNEEFIKSMGIIGRNNVIYEVLANCQKPMLLALEKCYIKLFKELGYTVFGDNRKGAISIDGTQNLYERFESDRLALANLNRKYKMIIKEYKSEEDKYDKKSMTEFMSEKMVEGVQRYKNLKIDHRNIIEKYMNAKVNFVDSALNYLAYEIFYDIYINEQSYRNNTCFHIRLVDNELKPFGWFGENILFRIKNDYNLNEELIKFIIHYSHNLYDLLSLDAVERVEVIVDRLNINIENMFDYLYYYIIVLCIEKSVCEYC